MDLSKLNLVATADGVRMAVKAVPGARKDRIVGELGGALKVAVSAPPERGQANRAIIGLLASRLGIAISRITLARGLTQPRKEVLIHGVSVSDVRRLLATEAQR